MSLRDGINGDEDFSAKVKIKKHSGKVDLIISAKGIEFNPIENLDEKLNSDDARYYNLAILKSYPSTLKFCEEKLGIDKKLSMFAIPFGMQFNMNGNAFYLAFVAIFLAKTLGIEIYRRRCRLNFAFGEVGEKIGRKNLFELKIHCRKKFFSCRIYRKIF